MNFDVCIPSYRRPEFPALKWLLEEKVPRNKIHLFLHDKLEEGDYLDSQEQDMEGINIHITKSSCMTDQRNYILRKMYPKAHVQMDDDVTGIRKVKNGKARRVKFIDEVERMFRVSKARGAHVFGTGVYRNPYFAEQQGYISVGKFFRNNLVGVSGYRPYPELVGPVGTDWELGLCALRDQVGLDRYNHIVLDVSLGTDTGMLGGIGPERYRFNGRFFKAMAKRYEPFIGREALKQFYPGLVKCLDDKWKHKCKWCGSGFWDDLHWKVHQLYPCPQARRGKRVQSGR